MGEGVGGEIEDALVTICVKGMAAILWSYSIQGGYIKHAYTNTHSGDGQAGIWDMSPTKRHMYY